MTMTQPSVRELLEQLGKQDLALSCSAFEMRKILAILKPAIPTRSGGLPVLSGVRIVSVGGGVKLTASDLDFTVSSLLPSATNTSDGLTVIPFAALAGFVGKVTAKTDRELSIMVSAKECTATLRMGGTTQEVRLLPADEYPRLTAPDFTDATRFDMALVADVIGAASTDQARPILCGVLFSDDELACTDSYRLHTTQSTTHLGEGKSLLVPAYNLRHAVKLGGQPLMAVGEREVSWRFDVSGPASQSDPRCVVMTTRLIEGEFPNYRGLFPSTSAIRLRCSIDKAELVDALVSVKAFCSEVNTPVRLHMTGNSVRVWAMEQDRGEVSHLIGGALFEAPDDCNGEFTASFNPDYLLDAVKDLRGERITLSGQDAQKPWITGDTREDDCGLRRRLLMPVRVQ